MKQLITAIACIIILMAMVVQYGQEQVNHAKISYVQKAIHNSKEIAKQDGYFTEDNIANLKSSIASVVGCSADDVIVDAPDITERVTRGQTINYKVTVPLKGYFAAANFWKLSDDENTATKTYDLVTTSEYLPK